MMIPDKEKLIAAILELLSKSGIALGELTRGNADDVEKAVSFAVNKIPALRFLPGGRERAKGLVLLAIDRLPKAPDEQPQLASAADVAAYLTQLQSRVRNLFGDAAATGRSHLGYKVGNDVECSRIVRDLQWVDSCIAATLDQRIESTVLKAQVLGCWQQAHGTKGTHQSAIECYESALVLAATIPESEAAVRFRYAMFSLEAPKEIGGGKERAIANLQRAVELAPDQSELRSRCVEELERLKKKSWGIFR